MADKSNLTNSTLYTSNNNHAIRDFTDISFNGIWFSKLGLYRVSNGSRYNEDLLPTIQDKTIQIPGGDGMYYFGSYYTQKNHNFNFAFDNLTEENLLNLKNLIGNKKICDLIYYEKPYIIYKAKISGNTSLQYICFDGKNGNRIYKGELSLSFISYNPYGICTKNKAYLNAYNENDYPNKKEWSAVSRLPNELSAFAYNNDDNGIATFNIKNCGDVDSDFILTIEPSSLAKSSDNKLMYFILSSSSGIQKHSLVIQSPYKYNNSFSEKPDIDSNTYNFLYVDTKKCLIYNERGEVKNYLIRSGTFPKIYKYDSAGSSTDSTTITLSAGTGENNEITNTITGITGLSIDYYYLYY